ncbi:MAG TPA: hypothetical protein VKR31_06920 [Rhizomicrobium sp.]|nr:hypothetical protein [Rhizomicrobium sp.]
MSRPIVYPAGAAKGTASPVQGCGRSVAGMKARAIFVRCGLGVR